MTKSIIQTGFHAGEWAPTLNARVDLAKYHAAAELLENFYVDYRGGVSTRPGTAYVAEAKFSDRATRLIPFQASVSVGYILEFGDGYIRFFANGAPVLVLGIPYEIATPYAAADLAQLKFAQDVNIMVLVHPNYAPRVLTLVTATNWTLGTITFGSTVSPPIGLGVVTTLGGGSVTYAYVVTSVDSNGQESPASSIASLANKQDITTTAGTNTVSWTAAANAVSYNVYKSQRSYSGVVPSGSSFGFVGNCTGVNFIDTNVSPDFTQSFPIAQNPFQGAPVTSITLVSSTAFTAVPVMTIAAAPAGGVTATASCSLGVTAATIDSFSLGNSYVGGEVLGFANGVSIVVDTVDGGGGVLTFHLVAGGALAAGSTPANPVFQTSTTGLGSGAGFNFTWSVTSVALISGGAGYAAPPTATSTPAGAIATTTIGAFIVNQNPSVVGFFQQRMVLAATPNAVQTFWMSQPGSYYNFNTSDPIQPDDSITGSLVSGQLNTIKSMVIMPAGLVILTEKASWLVNGGSAGSAVTPASIVANSQAFNGASDVPPIVANYDILYVQAKGSIVRDTTYDFYRNIFTGTDVSVLSSNLFYGFTVPEWAWAEEPFKVLWAVRSDGQMLTFTFLKEQELMGWAHSVTDGLFKSVATVTETVSFGKVDAVYTVVNRVINGVTKAYIERVAERIFVNGAADAWCVDAGIQYNGAPATNFAGAQHLAGKTVTGLADGLVITPFVMDVSGNFTLPVAASKVTIGIAFTPILRTLQLDTGEPTIQGKRKSISGVVVRAAETLGLSIGQSLATTVPMKDFVVGNIGTMTNDVVTGLVTGDGRTIIDPSWDPQGQYYITQPEPFPATILGVIPEFELGDTEPQGKAA